jgi:hypothetical protein
LFEVRKSVSGSFIIGNHGANQVRRDGDRKISSSPDSQACRHGIGGGRRPPQPRIHYLDCAVARPAEMKGDGLRFWHRTKSQSGHHAEASTPGPAQSPIEIMIHAGITGDHGAIGENDLRTG